MANSSFNIQSDIWDDNDFLALPWSARYLYTVLGSQKNVSMCGVQPYIPGLLAKVAGMTLDEFSAALRALITARFVVLDEDTAELLVRTFVKHSGILKIPNGVLAMSRDYCAISSRLVREGVMSNVTLEAVEKLSKTRNSAPKRFLEEFSKGFVNGFETDQETTVLEPLQEPLQEGCIVGSRLSVVGISDVEVGLNLTTFDSAIDENAAASLSPSGVPPTANRARRNVIHDQAFEAATIAWPESPEKHRRAFAAETAKRADEDHAPESLTRLAAFVIRLHGVTRLETLTKPARSGLMLRITELASLQPSEATLADAWRRHSKAHGWPADLGQRVQRIIDGWHTGPQTADRAPSSAASRQQERVDALKAKLSAIGGDVPELSA